MGQNTIDISKSLFHGNYRGICVNNKDPMSRGRIKVHVPGVYPEELANDPTNLPWALPLMPIFGGSWQNPLTGCLNKETGVCSNPLTTTPPYEGAQLAIYFENGNHLNPIYFGTFQCGPGWFPKNNEQHIIQTKNITIIVDESPISGQYNETSLSGTVSGTMIDYAESRNYCDSNNKHNTYLGQHPGVTKRHMPTRCDVKIFNNLENGCALNIGLTGTFNMFVSGDVYEEISGNKFETIHGSYYRMVYGATHEYFKDIHLYENETHLTEKVLGDNLRQIKGDTTHNVNGKLTQAIGKDHALSVDGIEDKKIGRGTTIFNRGSYDHFNAGAASYNIANSYMFNGAGNCFDATGMSRFSSNAMGEMRLLEGLFGNFEWDLGPRWELNTGITEVLASMVPAPVEIKLGSMTTLTIFADTETTQGPTIRQYTSPVFDAFAAGWRAATPVDITFFATGAINMEGVGAITISTEGALTMNSSIATLFAKGLLTLNGEGEAILSTAGSLTIVGVGEATLTSAGTTTVAGSLIDLVA